MSRRKSISIATLFATLVAGLFVAFAASPANAAGLSQRHFQGVGSGRCLDVDTNTNWKVQIWNCDDGSDESWGLQFIGTFQATGDSFYNIVNKRTNSCLGIQNSSTGQSVAAVMVSCSADVTHWWYFPTKVGGVTDFKNVGSGLCLDVRGNGTGNGTIVQQFGCNGTTAQLWRDQAL